MFLCDSVITLCNPVLDADGFDSYSTTVIKGVSWYGEVVSNVDNSGLRAANRYTIRIPTNADFGGKQFSEAKVDAVSGESFWSLHPGDVIVHGTVTSPSPTYKDLHEVYESVTVLGVTDNRLNRREPHWKVVGS